MKILVVGKGELALKIGEGAADAGGKAEYSEEYLDGFDLVFLDAAKAKPEVKGSIALFYAKGLLSVGNAVESALKKMPNARLVNQIALEKKGFLKNKLDEIDFERARAFGERTVRNALGIRPEKSSEKQRIRGYRK
ncbi:TPA: hypothetical protein HA244_02420 [Candidatus Micrarchaeota archaeon]|nr:hypothetical protein [Candidatus Micrarchaeota archaeon]